MAKKKTIKKIKDHGNFIAVLLLFAGFSIYSLASFFSANNTFINYYYASVSDIPFQENTAEPEYFSYFTDVPDNHPHIDAVTKLLNFGIIEGYPDGSFRPDDPMTRAGLLKVLATVVDADLSGLDLENCFLDVKDEWYAPFVCYAKNRAWISGHSDGFYRPGDAVTRSGAMKILMEALEYELCAVPAESSPFVDVDVDHWVFPYACAAKRDSITSVGTMFYPDEKMTRAQFVQILHNIMVKKEMF